MKIRATIIGGLVAVTLVIAALAIVVVFTTEPLHISSYKSGFGRVFDITARYKVTEQSIEILVIYGKMIHSKRATHRGRTDTIMFGLGTRTKHKWRTSEKGNKRPFVKETLPGDTIRLYLRRFSIPIDSSVELSSRWIVLEAQGSDTDSTGKVRSPVWWYAHSSKDIFRSIAPPKLTTAAQKSSSGPSADMKKRNAVAVQKRPARPTVDVKKRKTLFTAIKAGDNDTVRKLLDSGVDVNTQSPEGTPLTVAIGANQRETVELLLAKSADPNLRATKFGVLPLMVAGTRGDLTVIKDLVAAGANVNAVWVQGMTSLLYVMNFGQMEPAKLLVELGADPNVRDSCGRSALAIALSRGSVGDIDFLLKKGATVDSVNYFGQTPLMLAAMAGKQETVQLFLEAGSIVDRRDERGMTALMHAAKADHRDIVEMLLEVGAHINAKANGGNTALMYAQLTSPMQAATSLKEAGAEDIVGNLLARHDPNARSRNGMTTLIWAVVLNKPQLVRGLLRGHADINTADATGRTALFWVVKKGYMP
ncbi:MAG: ankyrin repeat domain-containing protein, partial [Deltaproteobacteria bacterium]|nr:ankyrin repeat domain-containing protein [Deltaproteobacteria bacterium]